MQIEIRQLRHLLAITELGSFSKAAEAVGLTQSALSRSIQALETVVQATVLDRARGEIVPTDLGAVLLRHARLIDTSLDNLTRDIALSKGLELGLLRIGVGPWGGAALVGPAIGQLSRLYPKLRIQTVVAPWQELPERAHGGDLDLIVLTLSQVEQQEDFEIRPLSPHPNLLVCRPGHPLAGGEVRSLHELFDYPLAGPTMDAPILKTLMAGLPAEMRNADTSNGLISIECDSASILKDVLFNSDAVSLMPDFMVSTDIANGYLSVIHGTDFGLRTRFGAAWLRHRTLSLAGRKFLELLETHDQSVSVQMQNTNIKVA